MIETFILDNIPNIKTKIENDEEFKPKFSLVNIIISLIISLGASYIAYQCNRHETEATRLIYVVIALFY